MKTKVVNVSLALASIAVTALFAVGVDRVVGAINARKPFTAGLMFTPNAEAHYKTIEFEYTVHTNNLGFRGDDTTLAKKRKTRIVAIGDSFTYGWGVQNEETWIKLLENALRAEGYDVEILNLGIPGGWPGGYVSTAEDVIPILKPDLVLVGLLQGDDLRQCDFGPAPHKSNTNSDRSPAMLEFFRNTLLPNLTGVAVRQRDLMAKRLEENSRGRWNFIDNTWKQQARGYLKLLNAAEMESFRRLPDPLPHAFQEGQMSPALLGMLFPDAAMRSLQKSKSKANGGEAADTGDEWKLPAPPDDELDIHSVGMQRRITASGDYLARLRAVADKAGARVVAVSIPAQSYVAVSGWQLLPAESRPKAVPPVRAENFATTTPDEAGRAACDRAKIPMIEVTAGFRKRAASVKCFYDYDTHFTAAGNKIFAESLASALRDYVK